MDRVDLGLKQIVDLRQEAVEQGLAAVRRRLEESAAVRREARARDAEMNRLLAKGDIESAGRERLKMLNKRYPNRITARALLGRPVPEHQVSTTQFLPLLSPKVTCFPDWPPYYFLTKDHQAPPPGTSCAADTDTSGFSVWAYSGTHACLNLWAHAGVGNAWLVQTPCCLRYTASFGMHNNWATYCSFAPVHSEGWIGLWALAYDSQWNLQDYPVWVQEWLWEDDSSWSGAGGGHLVDSTKELTSNYFVPRVGWYYVLLASGGVEISAEGTGGWPWSRAEAIISAGIPYMRIEKVTF